MRPNKIECLESFLAVVWMGSLADARVEMRDGASACASAECLGSSCLLVTRTVCRAARKMREIADESRLCVCGECDFALHAGCCCAKKTDK